MATITHRDIIQTMVDNDGVYPGDPQPIAIFEYRGAGGQVCWSVIYMEAELLSLMTSYYVCNPEEIWSRKRGKFRDPTRQID